MSCQQKGGCFLAVIRHTGTPTPRIRLYSLCHVTTAVQRTDANATERVHPVQFGQISRRNKATAAKNAQLKSSRKQNTPRKKLCVSCGGVHILKDSGSRFFRFVDVIRNFTGFSSFLLRRIRLPDVNVPLFAPPPVPVSDI